MIPLPRLRFASLPTPVEAVPGFPELPGSPMIFVKRDDLTGLAMGGNKTRKLEYLLAEAQAHGARTLITAGAAQSNHCRQTAAAAARFGFACILVLSGQRPDKFTGNLLLDHLFGAEIIWTTRTERDQVLQDTFGTAWKNGRRPYLIPYGGSSPTGAASYTNAIKELLDQIGEDSVLSSPPDWIVVASSSGGTQAGLVLGAKLYGYFGKILGISIDEEQEVLQDRVVDLARATAAVLGEKIQFNPDEILVNSNYLGEGYGVFGQPEKEALRLFASRTGLLLDPVYTGRAAAGMIDLIRKGYFSTDERLLFWHTGGTPAIFAGQYQDDVASI